MCAADVVTGSGLGVRLTALRKAAVGDYTAVWDIGADHGLLADAVRRDNAQRPVYAVDRVPALCSRMADRFPEVNVLCTEFGDLTLQPESDGSLVVIAGLGGDTVADMVESVIDRHPGLALHFLLCPVRQCWQLRGRLSRLPLAVTADQLIQERGRIYEVLRLAPSASPCLSQRPWPIGRTVWAVDAMRAQYVTERVHAHRHHADIAAAYAALLQPNSKAALACAG